MNRFLKLAGMTLSVLGFFGQAHSSDAAEVKVLSALGIKAVMDELVPNFERTTGHRLVVTFAPLRTASKIVRADRTFDVVILPARGMDGLVKERMVNKNSLRVLARSGMAVAIRKGAPRPDISTPEAFRRALLTAKSITYGRGAGSEHIEKVLQRLGIAADMKAKTIRGAPGKTGIRVANGEAEIGLSLLQVLLPVSGIDIVGPLPGNLQGTIVFSAATMTGTKMPKVSEALIEFLLSSEAAQTFKAKGLEPG